MEVVAIVSVIALLQYTWFSFYVGMMRQKHGVAAPAMQGAPEFERAMRVQQNTLEQLLVFLPSLWMYAHFANPRWAAGIGLVFVLGRFIYRASYLKDPGSRSTGFLLGFLATMYLLVGSLVAAGLNLYAG
ncbi:MAG: MAPEG family protein [Pseudomonadota bacterium]